MAGIRERSRRFPYLIVEAPSAEGDRLVSAFWEEGTLGVEELPAEVPSDSIFLRAYFENSNRRTACRQRIESELPDSIMVNSGSVTLDEWESLLHGGFEPVVVDPLLIAAPASPPPVPPGKKLLLINPGLGFGTGTHPTTRLCLELLRDTIQTGARVLDVGTGSGVLAIAASLLGAKDVTAVDIDPDAIANAAGNVALNGADEEINLRCGSIELVTGHSFDMVLANILTSTILDLLEKGLADLVATGGYLVLSGFRPEEADILCRAVSEIGLHERERHILGGWAAQLAQRPPG